MDDGTALWLLSALLQSVATIWGLFLFVYLFHYKWTNDIFRDVLTSLDDFEDQQKKIQAKTERTNKYDGLNLMRKYEESVNDLHKQGRTIENYTEVMKNWTLGKSLKIFYFFRP